MFDHLVGNTPLKTYFKQALQNNRLPQTLLFEGMNGIGKSLFAKEIAKALLGPDVMTDLHVYTPQNKSRLYSIDTIREMIEKEHAAPFGTRGKVFILEDAERMQPVSANALLKTLEEPSLDSTCILLTHEMQLMLPTLLSRCVVFHFQPLSQREVEKVLGDLGLSKEAAKHAGGSLGEAIRFASDPELEKQKEMIQNLLFEQKSYPEVYFALSQMEEKDPEGFSQRGKDLLKLIFMWHRDQHVKALGLDPKYLFFSEGQKGEAFPLLAFEKKLEKARESLERNMHPLTVFASLFLTSRASF